MNLAAALRQSCEWKCWRFKELPLSKSNMMGGVFCAREKKTRFSVTNDCARWGSNDLVNEHLYYFSSAIDYFKSAGVMVDVCVRAPWWRARWQVISIHHSIQSVWAISKAVQRKTEKHGRRRIRPKILPFECEELHQNRVSWCLEETFWKKGGWV